MPPRPSATPTPGSSTAQNKNPVGDALYNWCRDQEKLAGEIFTQQDLLDSGLIPGNSLLILLEATQYLVAKRLFKIHDIKGQTGVGWELVEEAAAAK